MKHIFFGILLFLFFFSHGQDCHFSVKGRVLDQHDGQPLSKAVINVYGINKEVLSDQNGYFIINSLCKGFIELEISHISCGTKFYPLNIFENTDQVFLLEHHIVALNEVAVLQRKAADPNKNKSLNTETLAQLTSLNFADALTQIQGITSLKTGGTIAKPLIQGFYGSRVITRNQGVRMQDMEWGDEHAPNIATSSVNKVSLITGAQALKYGGDAVGGVLVLDSKKPNFANITNLSAIFTGQSNGRGFQSSQNFDQNFKNGIYYGLQLDYKRAGNTKTPSLYMDNTGSEQLSVSVPFGWHKENWGIDSYISYFRANNAILSSSHIGNLSDLIGQINQSIPLKNASFSYDINNPKQEVSHFIGKLAFYRRFSDIGKLDIQYDYQQNNRKEYDIRLGNRNQVPGTDLKLETHALQTSFNVQTAQSKALEFGIDSKYQLHFPNPDTGVRRLIPDYHSISFGAFLYGKTSLTDNLMLSASLRTDYQEIKADKYYRKSRWESMGYGIQYAQFFVADFESQVLTAPSFSFPSYAAALSADYKKDSYTLQGHYQYVERAPNPAELFSEGLHHSAARIELGALDMDKEKAHKWSLQYEYTKGPTHLYIAPFFNFIKDYMVLLPTGVEFTIRGAFPVWEYTQTNAQFIGVDTKLSQQWSTHFKSIHGLSIVKAKDLINNSPFPNIPPISSQHEIEKNFKAVQGLSINLKGNYVFRQNETPENISVFNPYDQSQSILRINDSPPNYFLLSGFAAYAFPKKSSTSYKIRLIGENLSNINYRNYLNRLRYFSEEMGVNINLQFIVNF